MIDGAKLIKTYNGLNSINLSMSLFGTATTTSDGSWQYFNQLLNEAAKQTDDTHFLIYQIQPGAGHRGNPFVRINEYAPKVHAAARYFYDQYHEQYFDDDVQPPTLDGKPSVSSSTQIFNTHQNQENSQVQNTKITIEFNQTFQYVTEQLVRAEDKFDEGTPESGFISKLKGLMAGVRSTADIIKLIAATAAETGIAAETLKSIFS